MMKSAPTSVGSEDQVWTRGTGMFRTVLAKSIVATSLAATRCVFPMTGNGIRAKTSDPLSKRSRNIL